MNIHVNIGAPQNVFVRSVDEAGFGKAPALWMFHGFADSSLAFSELLHSEVAARFGLFAPDLPGFGVSPPDAACSSVDAYTDLFETLINDVTPDRPIGLIGHSVGAVIAVALAERLRDRTLGLMSIEGNLTPADAYFSGSAADYDLAAEFKQVFTDAIWRRANEDTDARTYRRYYASVLQADADTMWRFGSDVRQISDAGAVGEAYLTLACPSLYYWAPATTPEETQKFIAAHDLANRRYADTGHWPMISDPLETAAAVSGYFDKLAREM